MDAAERIARRFHERYEALAPDHGYSTRADSACPWDAVPANNRSLMVEVARALLLDGVIEPGPQVRCSTFPGPTPPVLAGQEELADVGEAR